VYLAQFLSYHSVNEEQGTKNLSRVTSASFIIHPASIIHPHDVIETTRVVILPLLEFAV